MSSVEDLRPPIRLHTRMPRRGGGRRRGVLLLILLGGVLAAYGLRLDPADLVPGPGGIQVAREFFSRALSPALSYESDTTALSVLPLPLKALQAAWTTVVFAATAMSLALLLGIVLGFLASSAWWAGDPAGGRSRMMTVLSRLTAPFVYGSTRVAIALMRSIHELIWAVLFLAAFGLSNLSAVIAIAIPFGGTLAKIFSEMIDEAPRDAAYALRTAGASPLKTYLFGLVPGALPDMTSYAFYRFECALRSSAILGFFGYPTLGFYLAASFENLHYGEVWTYLYVLFLLVAAFDWWSGAMRRRLAG